MGELNKTVVVNYGEGMLTGRGKTSDGTVIVEKKVVVLQGVKDYHCGHGNL